MIFHSRFTVMFVRFCFFLFLDIKFHNRIVCTYCAMYRQHRITFHSIAVVSGFFFIRCIYQPAKTNVPASEPCSGPKLWHIFKQMEATTKEINNNNKQCHHSTATTPLQTEPISKTTAIIVKTEKNVPQIPRGKKTHNGREREKGEALSYAYIHVGLAHNHINNAVHDG